MAVELAVILPVIIIICVIAVDCLVFVGQCARFDNVAAQRVLALAVSPDSDAYDLDCRIEDVSDALADDFSAFGQTVEVSADEPQALSGTVTFTCTLSFVPWPLTTSGGTLFGVGIPVSLDHDFAIAVDCYTPGDL